MIKPLTTAYLSQALEVLDIVKNHMIQQGLDQWDEHYPNQDTLTSDLHKQQAYIYLEHGKILAYMVLNEEYDIEYDDLVWSTKTPFLVIHRLFVHPIAQGKGISSQMILYAEQYAKEHLYHSIRFDAYSLNNTANTVYLKKGYSHVGTVTFRKGVFNCYEKAL